MITSGVWKYVAVYTWLIRYDPEFLHQLKEGDDSDKVLLLIAEHYGVKINTDSVLFANELMKAIENHGT